MQYVVRNYPLFSLISMGGLGRQGRLMVEAVDGFLELFLELRLPMTRVLRVVTSMMETSVHPSLKKISHDNLTQIYITNS